MGQAVAPMSPGHGLPGKLRGAAGPGKQGPPMVAQRTRDAAVPRWSHRGQHRPTRTQADPHDDYAAEITELAKLTERALDDPVNDSTVYIYLWQALLAFQGVEVWSNQLDRLTDEECPTQFPHCQTQNLVVFGQYGYFSTTDDMHMRHTNAKRVPCCLRTLRRWKNCLGGCTRARSAMVILT